MNLEERSFENLVYFYGRELRRILRGEKGTRVFSQCERSGLRVKGVLSCSGSRQRRAIVLTKRAEELLKSLGTGDPKPS